MNRIIFVLLFFHAIPVSFGQVIESFDVDFDSPVGYHDGYNTENVNFGNASHFSALQIPGYHFGVNTCRGFMTFDLSTIPFGSTVISAKLNLYAYTDFSVAPIQDGHYGSNECKLSRIISSWSENSVTWNTQPLVSTVHEVILSQSNAPNQDYLNIDVSSLVQDMIDEPTTSFGFRLALLNEVITSNLSFCSKEYPDSSKHPTLLVEYRLPSSAIVENFQEGFRFDPNPVQNAINMHFSDVSNERKVACLDVQGKIIFSMDANGQDVTMDLSSIKSGMYFIKVIDTNRTCYKERFFKL